MDAALLVLRVTVGLLVAAHGAQKLFGWFGGGGLAAASKMMASLGFRPAVGWTALGSLSELVGGILLALGLFSPLGSLGVGAAMAIAITKIHWPKLWATQHGFEYALVIFAAALALGLTGPGAYSLDAAWGTALPQHLRGFALAITVLGYLAAMVSSMSPAPAPSKATPAT